MKKLIEVKYLFKEHQNTVLRKFFKNEEQVKKIIEYVKNNSRLIEYKITHIKTVFDKKK